METKTELSSMFRIAKLNKKTKMESNLSVELMLITPELAENYLRFNNKNRKLSLDHVGFLSKEMISDRFLENGESIVFNEFGELQDGQHRLFSIIKSGKSYFIPVVRGVRSASMSTYDTGKNRTASDVLSLNGYKWTVKISALIKYIHVYDKKRRKENHSSGKRKDNLTNQQILEYCEENYDWLLDITKKCEIIYKASNPKIISVTRISLIAYLIGGESPTQSVYNFISHLVGNYRTPKTAVDYLYNKIYNSIVNKERLNLYWILGISIKAYNYFVEGNPAVRTVLFSIDQELPKPNKNNN